MANRVSFVFCLLSFVFFCFSSCARPSFVLPSGPGAPAPDARAAWLDATSRCRDVETYSAQLRLSGRAGATGKLRTTTVLAGLTRAGQIRLEAPAPFGRAIFTLAGSEARAVLLTRDRRVLTAPAGDILEALVGVSLGPAELTALLSGCGFIEPPSAEAARYSDLIALGAAGHRVFLRSTAGAWHVAAAESAGLVAEYRAGASLRLVSAPGRSPGLDLSISQSQVDATTPLAESAFTLDVPTDAMPLTLAELRASGPLGAPR